MSMVRAVHVDTLMPAEIRTTNTNAFAGIKTGGQRPPSRGEKARKRIAEKKEKEPKEKTVGKEMEQTGVPSAKKIKKKVE